MPTDLLDRVVWEKLRRLCRALRARLLGEGLAWVVLALTAGVFVTLGFDYLLHMDRPLRAFLMVLALAGAAYVTWRTVIAPLAVPMGSEDLALLIERRYGQLADRLISSVEFARAGDPGGASPAMVRRVAEEAGELARPLEFEDVVERRRYRRVLAAAACAIGLLAGLCLWQGPIMRLWFLRNVAMADTPWPQDTYLTVQGGPGFTVVRGDDLKVTVAAEPGSVAPPFVTFYSRYPSVGMAQERVEAADSPGTYVKTFQGVSEPFEFYVTGGDDHRDKRRPHAVRLVDPPSLEQLDFTVEYPGYANRAPARFEGGRGAIGVLAGSVVSLVGRSTKDLTSASLLLNDRPVGGVRVDRVSLEPQSKDADSPKAPRQVAGSFSVAGPSRAESLTLRFVLTDTEGYTSRRGAQYLIQVQPDLPPVLALARQGVSGNVTPNAVVPLVIDAKDDCGISAMSGAVLVKDSTTQPAPAEVPLPPARGQEFKFRHELDLQKMSLRAGQSISIRVEAADTLPKELGGPNRAAAEPMIFRLVTPEELAAELVGRQKALSLEFVEAISLQESTRAKTSSAADALETGSLTEEVRQQLRTAGQFQGSVAAECAKVADAIQSIAEEMRNNRIGTDTIRRSMEEGVVRPLKDLAEPMNKVVAALNATEGQTAAAEVGRQAREIAGLQQELLQRMQAVLKNMRVLETMPEIISQLRLVVKWSQELLGAIEKRSQEEVLRTLTPATQPAEVPDPNRVRSVP